MTFTFSLSLSHTVELPHIRVCVSFSGLILIIQWREAPTSEFSFMTFTFTFFTFTFTHRRVASYQGLCFFQWLDFDYLVKRGTDQRIFFYDFHFHFFHFHFHTPSSCLISGFVFLSVAWFWLSGEERHRPANLLLWLSATFEWIGREISHSCNCTRHGIKSGHLRWKKYIWEFSIKVGGNCSKSSHYMNDYMNYYKWCFTSFWMKRNTLAEACKLANLWRKLSLPG